MAFLLDTHILLWAILDDRKLSAKARKIITDASVPCYFSIVSLWEIAIKYSLGSLDLNMSLDECFTIIGDTGFTELGINRNHLMALDKLPYHHKDPFDRLLIAQGIREGLTIITKDGVFDKYNVQIAWQ